MGKSLMEELIIKISGEISPTLNASLRTSKKEIEAMTGEITRLASQGAVAFGAFSRKNITNF